MDKSMSGRERLLSVLQKQIPDRVPIGLFVQEEYLSWFFPERETVSRVKEAVECADYYDFDLITRENQFTVPFWIKDSYPNWEVNQESWIEHGIYHKKTVIETPSGKIQQIESGPYNPRILSGMHLHTSEFFIKTPDDYEIFKKYFPSEKKERLEERHEMAQRASDSVGERGITCPWGVGGVYNLVSSCRDIQDLLMDPLLQPDFYTDMMDFFTGWIVDDYGKMLETAYDALGIQGNIANASLMSEQYFRENIQPFEKRIADIVSESGKWTIYHNCGNARSLYPCYRDLGIDVWETVAPPPMGDNDLSDAKAFFGTDIILSGNLDQVSFLKQASLQDIEQRVKETMDAAKQGGAYIFAASDYLEPDTPEEHVKAVVKAGKKFGKYV